MGHNEWHNITYFDDICVHTYMRARKVIRDKCPR